jgi:putative flippase GtrA
VWLPSRQFIRFGLVGVAGFVVDASVLHLAMRYLGAGYYLGRLFSFLAAVTVSWALNRRFTFKERTELPATTEWARFVAANSVGGVINYAVYSLLVATVPAVRAVPTLGVAAGSLAGLVANFALSKRLVFVSAARRG